MALKHQDLETWLKSLPLSDEIKQKLEDELGADETKQVKVRETVLARSDYSRNMDALRDERKKLEDEVARAASESQALIQANTKWKTDNEGVFIKTQKKAEKLQAKVDAYNKKLAMLAAQGVIDPDDLDIEIAPDQTTQQVVSDPQTGRFITKEELNNLRRSEEATQFKALAVFEDLNDEHQKLFGERLKRTEVLDALAKSGKNLRPWWEETFKVKEKRDELAKAEEEKRFNERLATEKTKWISEHSVPAGGGPTIIPGGLSKQHILSTLPKASGGKSNTSDAVQQAIQHWQTLRAEGKVS